MADLQMQVMFRRDITAPLLVQTQVNLLMQGDNEANALVIDLYDGDQPADASGYTVAGYLLRADGAKVPLKGDVNGNRVTVQLNEHCYLVPGPYGAFVRLVKGEFKRTILKIAGEIESEGDGPVVDIDEKFVTVEDVIEQMEAMIQVTEAAQSATAAANAAASSANTATSGANTAAAKADAAAEAIEDLTVSSENVGPGIDAGVKISTENGKKNIHFKLPQGQTGATPDITFRVATGEPGTQVEIQQSGTPEAPVINLTIPRGDTGAVEGIDYYEGSPAALGIASPGTANGLARGNHVHPMPTASEVGALPAFGTAADAEKLGGKAPEYYIQPRNLLDNSDFRNPVNQRGKMVYDESGMTLDRWYVWIESGSGSVIVEDGYISVCFSEHGSMNQNFEKGVIDTNKQYTAAIKYKDRLHVSFPARFALYDDYDRFTIVDTRNGEISNIEWVAIYEGEYTADTLPPYVPKGYEAEFYNCTQGYPIGSIYMSLNSTSPAALFGGEWEQMKNRFLLGACDENPGGSTGGEATTTLSAGNLPAHVHTMSTGVEQPEGVGAQQSIYTAIIDKYTTASGQWYNQVRSGINENANGESFSNMPPYLAVYMWKRVA